MRRLVVTPRWLPATIGVLAGLLAVKSVTLVRTAAESGGIGDLSLWSGDARASAPAEAKAGAAKPADAKAGDAKPQAGKPGDQKAGDAKPMASDPPPADPPVTMSERAVLLELRQRRQELESREATLAERESVIVAAQDKLAARVDELRDLQKKLEALDSERRKQEDSSWQGLVQLYETMKPRDAATIFNDLAMPVLVQVMDRMKDAKAAAVLAAMDPDKARMLTQALARLRTRAEADARHTSPPVRPTQPGAPPQPAPQPQGRPRAPSG